MKIPSRQHRRMHGPRPPLGVETSYVQLLRRWLHKWNDTIRTAFLSGWHTRHVHHVRNDASEFVHKKVAGLKVELEQRLDPAKLGHEIKVIGQRVSKKNGEEIRRTIGVSLHTETGVGAAIEAFRDRNVDLITNMARAELDEISDLVQEAERLGLRVEELSAQLEERFGVSESRADLIARDQTLKLNGQLNGLRQQNAGIEKYIWTTSGDERVRDFHADLEGTTQVWGVPPVTDPYGNTNEPGGDYQCRCTAFPIIPALDETDENG